MAKQKVQFRITWDGQQQGQLYYLIDNGVVQFDASDNKTGRGKILVTYTSAAAPAHVIKWSLWFAGKTFKNLEAKASVDDGDEQDLNSSDSETDHWANEGTWSL